MGVTQRISFEYQLQQNRCGFRKMVTRMRILTFSRRWCFKSRSAGM